MESDAKQDVDIRSVGTAAAFVVRNRHDAIDVGKFIAIVEAEFGDRGNLLRLVAGTHAGGHDENEVSCSNAAIGTAESHEGWCFVRREVSRRRRVQIIRQRANQRDFVGHVRVGNHFSFRDSERCSDGLAILSDEFAGGNGGQRETIADADIRRNPNRTSGKFDIRARRQSRSSQRRRCRGHRR